MLFLMTSKPVPPLVETVIAEFGQRVIRITLNRPKKRNPLDRSTISQLAAIVRRIEDDDVGQIVVISGAGGHFSAGGDLNGYIDLYRRPAEFRKFLADFHGLLNVIEASRKIYIAAIEGYCVAGGLELLLACDVVLAVRSAKIGDAHLAYGQLPGAGGSQRLPRAIGSMRARYLMLTGTILSAPEAERIGLVSKVTADSELAGETTQLVEQLLAASPLGLRGMKHLVSQGMRMELDDALRMELDYVVDYVSTSNDASEGLVAFQEKREPQFTGT
jgi:enoyl-CoA hydratase/carnithine racemase